MNAPPPPSSAHGRSRFVGVILALIAAVGAVGYAAGSRMQNAADAASERDAPVASAITVSVENRVLNSTIITRGVVQYPSLTDMSLGGLVGGGSERQVVTVAPQPGDTINDGTVVAQVSGRPIVVVQGDQPSYRALRVGSEGADVNQLELALVRFGFDPGDVDQAYTTTTALAVADWYVSMGFTADGSTARSNRAAAVPAGEIVFLPSLPGTVEEVLAPVGSSVEGPILRISGGRLQIRVEASEADREFIVPGLAATIEISTQKTAGTVETVETLLDGKLSVVLSAADLEDGLANSSAKVTISLAASDGPVLAVPIAAVSTGADGTERISLLTDSGEPRDVEVTTGLSADGFVELAATATAVAEGDLLVVGWR